jgi:hypothetical protein
MILVDGTVPLPSSDVSLILDKWDSAKSLCPYFARSMLLLTCFEPSAPHLLHAQPHVAAHPVVVGALQIRPGGLP